MNNPADLINPLKGERLSVILIILLGWSCYSFADTSIKFLADTYNVWMIINAGSMGAALILGSWIVLQYGWRGFTSKKIGWHLLRGVIGASVGMLVVNAVAHIPLADFYGITFAAPFLVLILAYFLLKEPVGWHRWLSVTIGFAGVFILAGPQFATFNIGYIFAILAMIGVAFSAIVIRKIGKGDPLPLYGFYPVFIILIISSFISPPMETISQIATPDIWKFIIQVFGLIGGQMCVSYATAHARVTASIAPFVYIQILWGMFFGYFLFGDNPPDTTILGLTLIIGAGIYMIIREKQLNRE